MKSQIINLRKKIFAHFKNKALELETRTSELNAYLADQNEMANRDFKIVDIERIQETIMDTDVVYLGDFHTFDQNIRNVLRILKYIISQNKKCVLGLEMIQSEYQHCIEAYLDNQLTDLEFLDSINYHNSWRFPWTHYQLIFQLAKKHNINVIGLNTSGNLNQRDQFASQLIHKNFQKDQDMLQIVLYGELHITNNKIPTLVKNKSHLIRQTIIHQNLDQVYWKLIEQDQEQGIVEFNKNEFCLISAPPWVKYESMIYWYENLCDDPDFDIHEYIIENGKKTFSEDTNEQFHNLNIEMNHNLQLEIPLSELENFNIYDHTNLDYIEEQIRQETRPELVQFFEYLISTGHSFKLPEKATFYCSSYSMNRISYLAGIHLFYCRLDRPTLGRDIHASKDHQLFFVLHSFEAMFAFFFSKIINPHRKCDMFQDLLERGHSTDNIFEKSHLKLSRLILSKQTIGDLSPLSLGIVYESATTIGHILGEYLYQNFTDSLKKEDLKNLMQTIEITHDFYQNYLTTVLGQYNYMEHRKRTF